MSYMLRKPSSTGGSARTSSPAPGRRPSLASGLVQALSERIRRGQLAPGEQLPTEQALVEAFAVSRTVAREAVLRLQAAGLVTTRHGVGSFVSDGEPQAGLNGNHKGSSSVSVRADQLATLQDVVAVLELRMGLETEAAALAAQRRTTAQLKRMRAALAQFEDAVAAGHDAVAADLAFHLEIARATQNRRFIDLLTALGGVAIPRARLSPARSTAASRAEQVAYLARVNVEHASVLSAIAAGDSEAARAAMRTHLSNSRERRRQAALRAAA
jgi:GntR family transcriptional regulator, transcriptional repressor for pyruvate dehydrogenase complex